jgi:formylglycine-generating enzyme required for sulfatase activity
MNQALLRRFIIQHYNDEELEDLTFEYFPDVRQRFALGMTKSHKVRELISYAIRHGRQEHLEAALAETRPGVFPVSEALSQVFLQIPGPTQRDPQQIFVSYANPDTEIAHRLAEQLRRNGHRVWIAPESILPGEKWVAAISRGLDSSGVFLLVLSPHAVASRWVNDETNAAIASANRGELRFLSVLIAPTDMPALWKSRQYVSLHEDYSRGFNKLLAVLSGEPFTPLSRPESSDAESRSAPWWVKALGISALILVMALAGIAFYLALGKSAQVGQVVSPSVLGVASADLQSGQSTATQTAANQNGPLAEGADTPEPTDTAPPTLSPTMTPTPEPQPVLGDTRTRTLPGGIEIEQVYVPAGSFIMGDSDVLPNDESPSHEVTLDDFWLDKTEVTNVQFAAFVTDTNYTTTAERNGWSTVFLSNQEAMLSGANWRSPQGGTSSRNGLDDHPVVHLSWDDAYAYCDWANGRLPTEAEWEYAARGQTGSIFPWEGGFDANRLNHCDRNCPTSWANLGIDDGYGFTAPVGNYLDGASWTGALDMAGNVWEWVNDWYQSGYYETSPGINPLGPETGTKRVLRGGSWIDDEKKVTSFVRYQGSPEGSNNTLGFRCAQE